MSDRQALAFALFAVDLAMRRWPKDKDWPAAYRRLQGMLAEKRKEAGVVVAES